MICVKYPLKDLHVETLLSEFLAFVLGNSFSAVCFDKGYSCVPLSHKECDSKEIQNIQKVTI